MAMETLGDFDGPGLEALLRNFRAEYRETNEAGGAVYDAKADGSLLVVYARSGRYRVTRVPNACSC